MTETSTPQWIVTTDRSGTRAYALPTGQVVCKDGCGSMPVSVYYAGFVAWGKDGDEGHGMVDTIAEGKAWATQDAEVNAADAAAQAETDRVDAV